MADAIEANLSQGDTFWDIGANIGLYSLFASKIVGSDGGVVSFEPAPWVFTLLRSNTRGDDSIQIFQYGIGNADGSALFAAHGYSMAASFIEEVTELTAQGARQALSQLPRARWEINRIYDPTVPIRKVCVTTRKIDTLLSELQAPSLIKIDVEGFEL